MQRTYLFTNDHFEEGSGKKAEQIYRDENSGLHLIKKR
jgi:hypothetical protein